MSVEQETSEDTLRPRVSAFKPKAFEMCAFETLSEVKIQGAFDPLTLTVVESTSSPTDPMFEDFTRTVTLGPEFVADFGGEDASEDEQSEPHSDQELVGDSSTVGEFDEVTIDDGQVHAEDEPNSSGGAAEAMTAEAWAEQERILREEYERQVVAARAEGVESGRSEAVAESDEKLRGLEQRYANLVDDMGAQVQERIADVERKAVQFAVEVARKLVGSIVEINPEYILTIIKEAIALTGGASIKAIRVSPQDLEFLKLLSPEKQFKEFDGTWSFVADDTIRQGCVVETNAGSAEYDLEKAWERIKEQVAKVR